MGKKPSIITWNWQPAMSDGKEIYPEQYKEAEVGRGVTEIIEHTCEGEGDRWYYDVIYVNGQVTRVFNPNTVIYL